MKKQPPRRPSEAQCDALRLALSCAGAVGRDHALPRRKVLELLREERILSAMALVSRMPSVDRELRAILAVAPEYGIPLVSCNDGYYVAVTEDDVAACVRDLASRRGEISRRISALERLEIELVTAGGRLF